MHALAESGGPLSLLFEADSGRRLFRGHPLKLKGVQYFMPKKIAVARLRWPCFTFSFKREGYWYTAF